jgi:ParB family chromosome partitioning protein
MMLLPVSSRVASSAIFLIAARTNSSAILKEAAVLYKVDTDAITRKVKQEFTTKEEGHERGQARSEGQESCVNP